MRTAFLTKISQFLIWTLIFIGLIVQVFILPQISASISNQYAEYSGDRAIIQIIAEDEPKDFDFILDIEDRMVVVMRQLGRMEEADEVERRLASVREALADVPDSEELTLND